MREDLSHTYLTTEELAALIRYDARTIRNRLKDSVLIEGVHYIRPFGGRKILFIREAIERDLNGQLAGAGGAKPADEQKPRTAEQPKQRADALIPMAAGGYCNGQRPSEAGWPALL